MEHLNISRSQLAYANKNRDYMILKNYTTTCFQSAKTSNALQPSGTRKIPT